MWGSDPHRSCQGQYTSEESQQRSCVQRQPGREQRWNSFNVYQTDQSLLFSNLPRESRKFECQEDWGTSIDRGCSEPAIPVVMASTPWVIPLQAAVGHEAMYWLQQALMKFFNVRWLTLNPKKALHSKKPVENLF